MQRTAWWVLLVVFLGGIAAAYYYWQQGLRQLALDLRVGDAGGARTGDDEHILRRNQPGAALAEEFAHQTAHAIAGRRVAYLATGGDPESRWGGLFGARYHGEVRRPAPSARALQR